MNAVTKRIRVLFGGGGTGGHLFPGIAVAQELMARNRENEILFVNTGRPFERAALEKAGFRWAVIHAEGIKGRHLSEKLASMAKMPKGVWDSTRIVSRFRPDILVGLGSYASGVVVLAGWLSGKKIVLCEQNRLPGMTNRVLFHLADRLYVSFPGTRDRLKSNRVLFTGNPVRKSILTVSRDAGRVQGRFTVLVIGGSQGAHAINGVMTRALPLLPDKERFRFIHQTGSADASWVREAYAESGVLATVAPFFDDMDKQYAASDLVLCRSGASTVAELTALGKPALFVPFPFAADDHQTHNARELSDAGAAETFPQDQLDASLLAQRIVHLADRPETLSRMAQRAKAFGKPDAAATIVDDLYALLDRDRKKAGFLSRRQKG